MKIKLLVGFLALAAGLGGYSLVRSEAAAQERTAFLITVEATGSGVHLVCHKGCAWKELSFDCGERLPCRSPIDSWGMTRGGE